MSSLQFHRFAQQQRQTADRNHFLDQPSILQTSVSKIAMKLQFLATILAGLAAASPIDLEARQRMFHLDNPIPRALD